MIKREDKEPLTPLRVRIPNPMNESLSEIAEANFTTKTSVVCQALSEYLKSRVESKGETDERRA